MSLYAVQKLLYQLNRDADVRGRYESDFETLLSRYDLSGEERNAITAPDIGMP